MVTVIVTVRVAQEWRRRGRKRRVSHGDSEECEGEGDEEDEDGHEDGDEDGGARRSGLGDGSKGQEKKKARLTPRSSSLFFLALGWGEGQRA